MMKRFTLMMMVLCFLMCIPLKMMAEKVTIHYIDDENWAEIYAYVYQKGGGDIGPKWHGTQCTNFETVDGKRVATWTIDLGSTPVSNACVVFNNGDKQQHPVKGKEWIIENGAYYNKDGKTTVPTEGGGGTVTPPASTYDKITVVSKYLADSWGDNSNFNFTTDDGKIYTCVLQDVTADKIYFRIKKNDTQWGPQSTTEDLVLTSEYQKAYENSASKAFLINATIGQTITITWDNDK